MTDAWLALLPDFMVIAVGAAISRQFDESLWQGLDRLAFFVLYPALLFSAAAERPMAIDTVLTLGLFGWVVLGTGFLLGSATASLSRLSRTDFAGVLQNAWRFNTALGFVAIAALPPGATGLFAVLAGVSIPLANVLAVTMLARDRALSGIGLVREVATNPFLVASLAGVLVAVSGRSLPVVIDDAVERVADAALPLVLLSLGAALARADRALPDGQLVALHAIKLVLLPLVACGLGWLGATLGLLQPLAAATLLIFAALPTATAAHVLAARYGADRTRVALVVMQSSFAGLVTLPVWTLVAAWWLQVLR